jgi:hypothetical protein
MASVVKSLGRNQGVTGTGINIENHGVNDKLESHGQLSPTYIRRVPNRHRLRLPRSNKGCYSSY